MTANHKKKATTTTNATSASSSSSVSEADVTDDQKENHNANINEQLERAEDTVHKSTIRAEVLHDQWRTHLYRLCILMIMIACHQAQNPTTSCMKDIKEFNRSMIVSISDEISGVEAVIFVIKYAVVELLSIIMAGALALFVNVKKPPGDFSHPWYLISNAMLLPILGIRHGQDLNAGCIDDQLAEHDLLEERKASSADSRSFPVVIVLHVIITGCYFFMSRQMEQLKKNVLMVRKLRKDLENARAENEEKKKQR